MKKPKVNKRYRHGFRFHELDPLTEKVVTVVQRAKVVNAKAPLEIELTLADFDRSKKAKGMGNSQGCAIAAVLKRTPEMKHPFIGTVDVLNSRVMIASRRNKDGKILECVKYSHTSDVPAKFDTPKGRRELRARLEEGPIRITLKPPGNEVHNRPHHKRGEYDGSRSPRSQSGSGAKLRYAVAHPGYRPASD